MDGKIKDGQVSHLVVTKLLSRASRWNTDCPQVSKLANTRNLAISVDEFRNLRRSIFGLRGLNHVYGSETNIQKEFFDSPPLSTPLGLLSPTTLREFLQVNAQKIHWWTTEWDILLNGDEQMSELVMVDRTGHQCNPDYVIDLIVAIAIDIRRYFLKTWSPLAIGLAGKLPSSIVMRGISTLLACPIIGNYGHNALVLRKSDLSLPSRSHLPVTPYEKLVLSHSLAPDFRPNFISLIADFLENQADLLTTSLNSTAKHFGLNSKLLYRKLGKYGTQFELLRQNEIIRRSKLLLANSNETIEEIALKLGYSEGASFSRCFHKLTGEWPSDFRHSVR